MAKARLDIVEEILRRQGLPDCRSSKWVEDALLLARKFAADADRLEIEVEQLRDVVQRIRQVASAVD